MRGSFILCGGMEIFLIRHGQTTGDVENRYGGSYDDSLSDIGVEQVEEIAKELADKEIEVIFHSTLKRAEETAQIIGQELNLPLVPVKDLMERNNYGNLSGLTKKEALEEFPDEVEELEENPLYHKLENSEDYYSFAERIINSFNEIVETEYDSIAIITHGGPIKTIFREILGFEINGLKDCAIIRLEKDGGEFEIIGMNGVDGITPISVIE
jgi:broad specificity phosphatase PhoE